MKIDQEENMGQH